MARADKYRYPFFLRNVNDTLMRYICKTELEDMVNDGDAVRIYARQHGKPRELVGAKLTARASEAAETSSTAISKREMEVNAAAQAFLGNQSRTAGMAEERRLENINRHTNRVEEEDFIERGETKVAIWQLTGDTKAPRVGARPDTESLYLAAEHVSTQMGLRKNFKIARIEHAEKLQQSKAAFREAMGLTEPSAGMEMPQCTPETL
jgi:hypothetical protein